jgi:hypothetical protein
MVFEWIDRLSNTEGVDRNGTDVQDTQGGPELTFALREGFCAAEQCANYENNKIFEETLEKPYACRPKTEKLLYGQRCADCD